jgi:uncharacterized OsmC-like protein
MITQDFIKATSEKIWVVLDKSKTCSISKTITKEETHFKEI